MRIHADPDPKHWYKAPFPSLEKMLADKLFFFVFQVGSGVFDPVVPDPEHACASNTTAWELSLLANHYHHQAAR